MHGFLLKMQKYKFSTKLTFYIQNTISKLPSLTRIVLVKAYPYVHTSYEYIRHILFYAWLGFYIFKLVHLHTRFAILVGF